MLAAPGAWDELAMESTTLATAVESVIIGLIGGSWLGASTTRMGAAATFCVAWLKAGAAQAERAAGQAAAAAVAYECARAMTVHPAFVAANRAQLTVLIATNLLGQNSPAIAAPEAGLVRRSADAGRAGIGADQRSCRGVIISTVQL
ncbi:PPE family protein PPE18 [Mycobacterium attenuatum]|uniref:PPE family protein PPE18 n=1 Tax=Mycobacterium attenuatum TaxID=2341086 RepID=A0A498QCG7_9MYCO|nr:PPE family protein [Mycobacterium attenuatum]VBA42659.1 PPE family protein PPE18 [Mycobacterium attenuatum]